MEKSKLIGRAALNALAVLVYVSLVATIMHNGNRWFGTLNNNSLFGPIAFLLLFIFSALLTGGLILGKPVMLYLDGAKKDGLKLLLYTGADLFILLLLAFVILFWIK